MDAAGVITLIIFVAVMAWGWNGYKKLPDASNDGEGMPPPEFWENFDDRP